MPKKSKIAEDKLTYSDYCLLPDNGKRYEIIDGELYNAPAPFTRHQSISRNLERIIANYCFDYHHGQVWTAPIDVIFSEIDIVQPDIVWVSDKNMKIVTKKNIQGAPDLAVEIISTYTNRKDRILKRKLYSRYGVSEYWIIDPEKNTVEVFRRKGKILKIVRVYGQNEILTSPLFPSLAIDLRYVFF